MTVTCPNCEWCAEVPDEKIPAEGGKGTCPKCQTKFEVKKEAKPIIEPPPVLSSPTHSDTKPCPLCGEEILTIAKKCKHCKSMLVDALESKPNEEHILSSHQDFKNITDFGKCSNCGESLDDDSGFCAKCGVLQVRKSMKVTSGNNTKHETKPGNTASVVKTTLIVVVTLAVIAGVVNFSIYHLSGKADVDKAERRAADAESLARMYDNRVKKYKDAFNKAKNDNNYEDLKSLVSSGVSMKEAIRDVGYGFTPNDIVSTKKLIDFLLENGADINVKQNGYEMLCFYQRTARHRGDLAYTFSVEISEYLISKGGVCTKSVPDI